MCFLPYLPELIPTKLSSQQPFFFLFFFEPKCHSKLFMTTTSLVVRVLTFCHEQKGTKVWALLGGHTVRHESWGQNAEKGLKETLLEAFPFLFRQSSETEIMVLLLSSWWFSAPPGKERFPVCSDTKADDQQCRHKVAQQKFVPQTNSKFLSLDFNPESHLESRSSSGMWYIHVQGDSLSWTCGKGISPTSDGLVMVAGCVRNSTIS